MIPAIAHSLLLIGLFAGVACMGIYGLINSTDWLIQKFGRQDA